MGRETLEGLAREKHEDARNYERMSVALTAAAVAGRLLLEAALSWLALIALASLVLAILAFKARRDASMLWGEALKRDPDAGELGSLAIAAIAGLTLILLLLDALMK